MLIWNPNWIAWNSDTFPWDVSKRAAFLTCIFRLMGVYWQVAGNREEGLTMRDLAVRCSAQRTLQSAFWPGGDRSQA